MAGQWVYINGVKLWQEIDEHDISAMNEGNAEVKLNSLRPDERRKHQVKDRVKSDK
jgi:hypothetical protein